MPKIIENLESRLMEEAKRQIEAYGYSATTVRSVAKSCGVGVGTVYNYFPSKDMLLATYMLNDWNTCISLIREVSAGSQLPEPVIRCIYDQLQAYARRHQAIFRDEAAVASFGGSLGHYHGLLRSQLAAPVRKFCSGDFAAEFIAESLLTWTMEEKPFDEIYGMIERLL